jgi:hypothetical protein
MRSVSEEQCHKGSRAWLCGTEAAALTTSAQAEDGGGAIGTWRVVLRAVCAVKISHFAMIGRVDGSCSACTKDDVSGSSKKGGMRQLRKGGILEWQLQLSGPAAAR